jgi:hypothetical protein
MTANNDKSVWLAVASRKLELGIPMLVTPDQAQSLEKLGEEKRR